MTPYYQDDSVTIYHERCEAVMPHISDVDLVFTSPPYNLSTTVGGGFGHYAAGVGDLWRVPQESNTSHPCPFPVGLPARAIESTAPRLILDPFMGSGTTLRAAKDAGVEAIGIEKSERYCKIAANRMAQEVLAL